MAGSLPFLTLMHTSLHDRGKGFLSSEICNYFEKAVLSIFSEGNSYDENLIEKFQPE
jgi:hypothetical protein